MEIARNQWPALRDLFAANRLNLTGFDLIEYFINYQPVSSDDSIEIYTTDKDWITHGNYMLIVGVDWISFSSVIKWFRFQHTLLSKSYVYFDTVKGSLEDLESLLGSINLKNFHLICGYPESYKTIVEQYWQSLGRDLSELEHQGTVVYHLPSSEVHKWESR